MSRLIARLAALLVSMLAGCGGPEPAPITLTFTSALDPRVEKVTVRLFVGDQSCDVIELSGPDTPGSYENSATLVAETGTFAEISSLRPDVYTVVAWAFDANGQALQYGCTEMPVTIENGVRTEITLGLEDYDAP